MTGMLLLGARAPSLQREMTGCQALAPAAMEQAALQPLVTLLASLQARLLRLLRPATPLYASHYPAPSGRRLSRSCENSLFTPCLGSHTTNFLRK